MRSTGQHTAHAGSHNNQQSHQHSTQRPNEKCAAATPTASDGRNAIACWQQSKLPALADWIGHSGHVLELYWPHVVHHLCRCSACPSPRQTHPKRQPQSHRVCCQPHGFHLHQLSCRPPSSRWLYFSCCRVQSKSSASTARTAVLQHLGCATCCQARQQHCRNAAALPDAEHQACLLLSIKPACCSAITGPGRSMLCCCC